MYPTLFQIGGIRIPSFGVMVMVGFLLGLWLAAKRAHRYGISKEKLLDIAIWTLVAGILGARIGFIVQELPYFAQHPEKLWSLQFEGMTSFGGIFGGMIVLSVYAKRLRMPVTTLFDVAAPSFLVGHIVGRIGCLLNGCCYGGQCDLPWGIHVAGQEGLFHPAQIYDGLMNLGGLVFFLLVLDKRKLGIGQAAGYAMIIYGLARFVYEFWRAGTTSTTMLGTPFTEAQLVALILAAVGATLWVRGAKRPYEAGEARAA